MKKLIHANGPRYRLSTDIPEYYDKETLCILNCTPTVWYAYWELPSNQRAKNQNLQMRISRIDASGNLSNIVFQTAIAPDEHSRYLEIPSFGTSYLIEIGTITDDSFIPLLCALENTETRQTASSCIAELPHDSTHSAIPDLSPSLYDVKQEVSRGLHHFKTNIINQQCSCSSPSLLPEKKDSP